MNPVDASPVRFDSIEAGDVTDPTQSVRMDRAQRTIPAWRASLVRIFAVRALRLLDVIAVVLALSLPHLDWYENTARVLVITTIVASVLVLTWIAGGYRIEGRAGRRSPRWAALASVTAMSLSWAFLKFLSAKLGVPPLSPPTALTFILPVLAIGTYAAISRTIAVRLLHRIASRGAVLFVGYKPDFQAISQEWAKQDQAQPLHWIDGDLDDHQVSQAIDEHLQHPASYIVLDIPFGFLGHQVISTLIDARAAAIPIVSLTQLHEDLWERTPLDTKDLSWIVQDEQLRGSASVIGSGLQRLLDIIGATVLIVLTAPLFALAAIAIVITDPGPIFFRQRRDGQWKQPFTLVKFRTMIVDAEKVGGAQWSSENDPRITRVGRFLRRTRIDELPQLFNVLAGTMSLVGPRPERPEFNERLATHIPFYDLRNVVKPGVTGWAQVNYPYGASLQDAINKLEYDAYYIRHASVIFDLIVLSRTIPVVLGMRGR